MDILKLHSELLVIIMELLYFSDKLNFSIVCKKFYKLSYIFYLDQKNLKMVLTKKRREYNNYVCKYIKNKKKLHKNIKRYISFNNQRNYSINCFCVKNESEFNKSFDNSSHYLYREYDDCKKIDMIIPEKYYSYSKYTPLTVNKITGATNQKSMIKYVIEGIPEFFNYVNYNNIQYLFIENAQLTLIPKNIVVLTLVHCDNSSEIIFKKLGEYKNLTDVNLKYNRNVDIIPDKLCSLDKLSLTCINNLEIKNVSVGSLKICLVDNIEFAQKTLEIKELIFDTFEEYIEIPSQKIIIKNVKYTFNNENDILSLKNKCPNIKFENVYISTSKLQDFSKIQNIVNLFDTIIIKVKGDNPYDIKESSLNLNNISCNELIICSEYTSSVNLNFYNVVLNILKLNLSNYKLEIVNSDIKTTKIVEIPDIYIYPQVKN